MKKTNYFILAAAAALFAACSSDDGLAPEKQQIAQTGEVPVAFDSYVDRNTTRAGATGPTNTAGLQSSGFGIFAYYTNSDIYDPIFTPNFMYNTKVEYKSSAWTYSPVKYWPNEFLSANAEENDKVSFFAYAPYVACTTTGRLTADDAEKMDYGIVGFSRNNAAGDPLVKYIASFDISKRVDLLWGVCDQTTWAIKPATPATNQTMKAGFPWLDVQHPAKLNQKMTFTFKHALASLNMDVDLLADEATTASAAKTGTKVYIRSVTFTGLATKGALNLNNAEANVPLWLSFDGTTDVESGQEITIYDGRKDGKEGLFAASNEKAFINTALTQTTVWGASGQQLGVTETATNLFLNATAKTNPIYVIPTGDKLSVTIVYDVMTEDPSLPGYLNDGKTHGSVVTNTITKEIKTDSSESITLEGSKQYTVHLHIGLQSVQVDATISGWGAGADGSADLPANDAAGS